MIRFLSNSTNKIDAKGRVSVPAHFRSVLSRLDIHELYCLQDFVFPAITIGGPDILERYENRMATLDPFSEEANQLSLLVHGGGVFTKLDGEGRLMVTDFIRAHTGIADQVTFVGRSDHFQLWAPDEFQMRSIQARQVVTGTRNGGGAQPV